MNLIKTATKLYKEYKKAVMAIVGAIVVTGAALKDHQVTSDEWIQIVAAWTTVGAVYQARNIPQK